MMAKAREAARLTPASRNRAADFYRTLAICFVVLGHWMLVAPYAPAGEIELRNSTDANAIFDRLGSTETNRLVLKQRVEDKFRRVGELILDWQEDGFDALDKVRTGVFD